jgi:NAD(P)-dependent dehydrogenase (short-subunit alcohol dehydrogenase family)
MTSTRRALVIGGTGMLAGCVSRLIDAGWTVVLPSRRRPVAASTNDGALHWVQAQWAAPEQLAAKVGEALDHSADLLIAWVHSPYRPRVLAAVEPHLAANAPVVEVIGSSSRDPLTNRPDPVLEGRTTHQVVLGWQPTAQGSRWLSNAEISDGVFAAVSLALDGDTARLHEVGTVRPWSDRP